MATADWSVRASRSWRARVARLMARRLKVSIPAVPPLSAQSAEELSHVGDEQVGYLECGEVAAGVEVGPVGDGVVLLGVGADGDVVGEGGDAGGDVGAGGPFAGVGHLVVEAGGGVGGAGEPVEHDVGEDAVAVDDLVGECVDGVGPLLDLVDDPGELAGG